MSSLRNEFEADLRRQIAGSKAKPRYAAPAGTLFAALSMLGVVSGCGAEEFDDGSGVDGNVHALASPVTVSFQNGALPNASYTGSIDATIKQRSTTTNYGGATSCEVDGNDESSADKSCLLGWAVSGIPAGSTVQSATITLEVVNASVATYNLNALNRSWDESRVTWNRGTENASWSTAGALGSSDRGGLIGTVASRSAGSTTITLSSAGVALVQGWVGGTSNRGIILSHPSNEDGLDFASSEHATVSSRPKLTITYVPPATTSTEEPGGGASCGYQSQGGGEVLRASGCFLWGSTVVDYRSSGGVFPSSDRTIDTPAVRGEYEVIAFGASNGGDESADVDVHMDSDRMREQGFRAIGVRGSKDKKIELWVRQNNGQTRITLPSLSKAYSVLALRGRDLNLSGILKGDVQSGSSTSWRVPSVSGSNFKVLAYFGDDSFEVTNSRPGGLIFNKWGFGDGDSLNVMIFAPGQAPPERISVRKHDSGGSQYVGILANFPAQ